MSIVVIPSPLVGGHILGLSIGRDLFPPWLQSDTMPIHIKEFWDVIVEVLDNERPRDPGMQELLREFLYIVCTRRFTPIFRKIGTTENSTADFISRCHDPRIIANYFKTSHLPVLTPVVARDTLFTLRANW